MVGVSALHNNYKNNVFKLLEKWLLWNQVFILNAVQLVALELPVKIASFKIDSVVINTNALPCESFVSFACLRILVFQLKGRLVLLTLRG